MSGYDGCSDEVERSVIVLTNNKHKIQQLKQYRDLIKELDLLMSSYTTLRIKLMSPKVPVLNQDVIQTSMTDTTTENLAEMLDLEKCIELRKVQIIQQRIYLEDYIHQVPFSNLRNILRCRYVNGWSWEKVCTEMSYSWMQIHRMHSKSLSYIKDDTQ